MAKKAKTFTVKLDEVLADYYPDIPDGWMLGRALELKGVTKQKIVFELVPDSDYENEFDENEDDDSDSE